MADPLGLSSWIVQRIVTRRMSQCSAAEALDESLSWISIKIYAIPEYSSTRQRILRVYDVRDIIRRRLLASLTPNMEIEGSVLMAEVAQVVDGRAPTLVEAYVVNGRLVINTEFTRHLVLELYLAGLE